MIFLASAVLVAFTILGAMKLTYKKVVSVLKKLLLL